MFLKIYIYTGTHKLTRHIENLELDKVLVQNETLSQSTFNS